MMMAKVVLRHLRRFEGLIAIPSVSIDRDNPRSTHVRHGYLRYLHPLDLPGTTRKVGLIICRHKSPESDNSGKVVDASLPLAASPSSPASAQDRREMWP